MSDDGGAALTIADAARTAGTDRGSIRRRLHAGEFPGAFKDAQGFWRIPQAELRSGVDAEGPDAVASEPPAANSEAGAREVELTELRLRAEKAEALLAAERRLSEELSRSLQLERRTIEALIGRIAPEMPVDDRVPVAPPPRTTWQAGLRAARAREREQRAARDRHTAGPAVQ
jgi:hypothetical protein